MIRKQLAAILTLALTLGGASAFADSRHQRETDGWRNSPYGSGHQTFDGRIREIDRDRDGYVIELGGVREKLFVPRDVDVRGSHGLRDVNRGDRIRAIGARDSRGFIYVRRLEILIDRERPRDRRDDDRYDERAMRGVVENIDVARRIIWLRDTRTGRTQRIDARYEKPEFARIRRGDVIIVYGHWEGSRYEADQIEFTRRR